ncbi:hypothetical protein F2Q69_00006592 [Brassica cretica]|uniref:Uncharacterized protein n=1 Tax=Brassica cretica TaxID=69181 RepID=A0A8S9NZD4_BRACR|nr:hypothetical protein F2Q69_00006592 [Brassica cretica]
MPRSKRAPSLSLRLNGGQKVPEGLLTVRELLRGRPCFWADFSPKRVRRDVTLYRSRFQSDLRTEEGSESSMDGFIPYVPQTKKDRSKPRKDKHIMVDEDVFDGQFSPDTILKDYQDSQAGGSNGEQFNLDGLFDFDFLRPQAEVADKEIARLKDELGISRRRERESFEKEVNNAYKRGKREIVEVMKSCRDRFSQSFGELKGCYKAFVDYRECRGTVGGLYLTQLPDYSFSSEYEN